MELKKTETSSLLLWIAALSWYLEKHPGATPDFCKTIITEWEQLPGITQAWISKIVDEQAEACPCNAVGDSKAEQEAWQQVRKLWAK